MLSIVNLYTLISQMGPLVHASQQGCPPKSLEQSDPEHTLLLLVPSRSTSTSESSAQQRSCVNIQCTLLVLSFPKVKPEQTMQIQIRRHNITKTCLYTFDPHKPHFYIVKLGFTGVYIIFLISAQKHRLWVPFRTASPRRF